MIVPKAAASTAGRSSQPERRRFKSDRKKPCNRTVTGFLSLSGKPRQVLLLFAAPAHGLPKSLLDVDQHFHGSLPVFVDVLIRLQIILKGKVAAHQGAEADLSLGNQPNCVQVVLFSIHH